MLFRNYHIVMFKDGVGQCRKMRLGGWVVGLFCVLLVGLTAGNVYLWQFYQRHTNAEQHLAATEREMQDQKVQILSLAGKLKQLEGDLLRIRDFDSKLRVMMNLESSSAQATSPIGGPDAKDFSKNYLTLYRQELLARKMHNFLRQLSVEAQLEEVRQQELIHTIRTERDILSATPSIWPTEGWVSSDFGYRTSPFTGKREFHKGLDISAPSGTPVYAPAKGVVSFAGRKGAYGVTIILEHGTGVTTRYAHLSSISIKPGKEATRGELIGYVGSSGRSTGPHLHYEVRLNGVPVDPMRYILN